MESTEIKRMIAESRTRTLDQALIDIALQLEEIKKQVFIIKSESVTTCPHHDDVHYHLCKAIEYIDEISL